jgi:hypothetical protein
MPSGRTTAILVNGARGTRRRGAGTCTACENAVWWCATPAGKWMPFDEAPDVLELLGDVEIVSADHVHWRTCTHPERFRKPKTPPHGGLES